MGVPKIDKPTDMACDVAPDVFSVEVGADATVLDLKKQIGEAIDEEKTTRRSIVIMHGYRSIF